MDKYLKQNKLVTTAVLISLLIVAMFYFYNKTKIEQKLLSIAIEKQDKCQKDGREFDEIFRERKSKNLISDKIIIGDGRFNLIPFKGSDICVYQNNWTEIVTSGDTIEAFVHHRIINISTQEELASVDWTRKFFNGEWKENFNDEDIDKTAKFVIIEKSTFGNSIIFPNVEE